MTAWDFLNNHGKSLIEMVEILAMLAFFAFLGARRRG